MIFSYEYELILKNQKDGIQSELAYMEIPNRKQCFFSFFCLYVDVELICSLAFIVKGPKHCVSFVTTTIEV